MADVLEFKITADADQATAELDRMRDSLANAGRGVPNLFNNLRQGARDALRDFGGFSDIAKRATDSITDLAGGSGAAGRGLQSLGSAAGAAGAGVGLVVTAAAAGTAALVGFTIAQAALARELELSSSVTGLGVRQLQVYERAAATAGASSSALTSAFAQFREETGRNARSFDGLLRSLESIQSPAERLAIAQANIGKLSEDTSRAIIALTDNQGALRKEIEASGLVLSEFETRELAKIQQRFDALKIQLEGSFKRTMLDTIDTLSEIGVALGEGSEGVDRLRAAETAAENAARGLNDALSGQSGAINELKIALDSLNEKSIQGAVERRIEGLIESLSLAAKRALTKDEAAKVFKEQLDLDPLLKQGVELGRIFEANRKLFQDLLKPPGEKKVGEDSPARERLKQLEAQLREEQRLFGANQTALNRRFEQRLIDEKAFTDQLNAIADARLKGILLRLEKERAVVVGANFKPEVKQTEIQRIANAEADARRQAASETQRNNDESARRIRQSEQELAQLQLQLIQANGQARIEAIRDAAEQGALSFAEGERRITEILKTEIEARLALTQRDPALFGLNEEQRRAAEARVAQIRAESQAQTEAAARRERDARRRDLEERRRYVDELQRLQEEAASLNLDALSTAEISNKDRIRARAELARQTAQREFDFIRQRLEAEISANEVDKSEDLETQSTKLRNRQRITEQLIALAQRARDEINSINRQEQTDVDADNPTSDANLFGQRFADQLRVLEEALGRPATLMERLRIETKLTVDDLARQTPRMGQVLQQMATATRGALANTIAAFASGRQAIGAVVGAFVSAALAPLRDYLLKKAAIHFAEAASRFAYGDYAGAFLHGAAGAGLSAAAGLIDGAGSAIGNAISGSGGGGSAAAGAFNGGTRQGENTRATEDRFRFFGETPDRPVTTIVIKHEPGIMVDKVEQAVMQSYQQDGAVRKVIRRETNNEPLS